MPNKLQETTVDYFKELVWQSLVKEAVKKIFARIPLLGWGPFGIVINHFAVKFAGELYSLVKLVINVNLIIHNNRELQKEYTAASLRLKAIASKNGIDSVEFRKARDEDKAALSKFVQFDVARVP